MTPLSDQRRHLLFDYSLGLTSESETAEAEGLLAYSHEAAIFHSLLKFSLAPLDALEVEPCPEELAERTLLRLREAARSGARLPRRPVVSGSRSSRDRLEELLAVEQSATRAIKVPLWRNWSEVVTAAAAVVLFAGVLFPTIGYMRQRYWRSGCGAQLGSVYDGLHNYVSDHDGLLPKVAMSPGSPWWRVGYQGRENYSNTRGAWLLVQGRYVEPSRFLCPGRRVDRRIAFEGIPIASFNDFPSRAYIHFSLRIGCPTSSERGLTQKGVLLADRNPLCENLPSDPTNCATSLCLQLRDELLTANSANHDRRGQNVLLYDGSVEFARERHTSISEDDIYLLRNMSRGSEVRGCEFPASDSDIFVAP